MFCFVFPVLIFPVLLVIVSFYSYLLVPRLFSVLLITLSVYLSSQFRLFIVPCCFGLCDFVLYYFVFLLDLLKTCYIRRHYCALAATIRDCSNLRSRCRSEKHVCWYVSLGWKGGRAFYLHPKPQHKSLLHETLTLKTQESHLKLSRESSHERNMTQCGTEICINI